MWRLDGLSGCSFLAWQKTASANMAATRRNVCRRCERFLRQQKPHLQKAGLSAFCQFTRGAANGGKLARTDWNLSPKDERRGVGLSYNIAIQA
jgi:hypothetical protein